jgi:RES domain-containing protein
MRSGWRIVRASHAKDAFSGEGSRLLGGRWNSVGTTVTYLSEHESLAALELLVHTMPLPPTERYFSFQVQWDHRLTEYFPIDDLPHHWNAERPPIAAQEIGDRWVREKRSVVLALPSLLSTIELNFLLNPNHPDFKKIKIGKPIEYRFDRRLLDR